MDLTLTGIAFDHSQDSILVHTVIDGRPHLIYVPVLALSSRMAMYDLDNEADAFEAIMREHHHRLNETAPESGTRVERAAGLQDVTDGAITIPAEAHSALAKLYKKHEARISEHHELKKEHEAARVEQDAPKQETQTLWSSDSQFKLVKDAYNKDSVLYAPGVVKMPDLKEVWKSLGGHVLSAKEVTVAGLPDELSVLASAVPGEPVQTIVRLSPQPTPAHVDESMAAAGCDTATLFVERSGKLEGFKTIFPELGIEFDLQSGDALSYGTGVLHGNTPVTDRGDGSYRRLVIVGSRRGA